MQILALAALAAVQTAGPPAPEIAVVVAGAGKIDFAGDTLARVAPEDGSGMFRRTPAAFEAADFEACGATGVEPEACVREILAAWGAASLEGPPTVILWVGPGPGFLTGWSCIGVGAEPTAPGRQRINLDWSPGQEASNAGKAAGCVLAAAAESGW